MRTSERLIHRLEAIGQALSNSGNALALLGLGSVGLDLDRLDDYSDLDFFAIVEPGQKLRFIENLDWLASAGEIAYCFRNTYDGYKLMYADGVFCEFAVFEPHELQLIPFQQGRIVWQRPDFNADCCQPGPKASPESSTDIQWLVGEAITNLYVGLCRFQRGEKLSALTFIQYYAFQRVMDLNGLLLVNRHQGQDPFARDRRYEQRYPEMTPNLNNMLQGYAGIPESAFAILAYLDSHFEVNPAMSQEIKRLCQA